MSDARGFDGESLPWLEAVENEDGPRAISARKMLVGLILVLLAGAIVAGTMFWIGRRDPAPGGAIELIKAEPGPYKVKPTDPGGLDVAGESETAFRTSAGEDADAQLNLGSVPEAPPAPPKAEPKPAEPATPAEPQPAPTGGNGSVIQLGAFKNGAQAERAWTALSARFPSIASMNKMIVPFSGGIRLRAGAASPADARSACQALKAAGENCFVAN